MIMFIYLANNMQNRDLPSQILNRSTILFFVYNPSYQIPYKLDDRTPHTSSTLGNTNSLINMVVCVLSLSI